MKAIAYRVVVFVVMLVTVCGVCSHAAEREKLGRTGKMQVLVDKTRMHEPMAVVVTAQEPTSVAQYAAEELVYHVEKATGIKLQIVTENAIPGEPAGRIYIGNCEAARAAGIEPAKLAAEVCVLKTTDQGLFIAGEDGDGDPLSTGTRAGTLWGVYELLERVLKVRWLWPGELGVYVPKTDTVKVGELDETISPWLIQRKIRDNVKPSLGTVEGEFSPEARKKYVRNQTVFLRRHRMGQSISLRYGHAFGDWWKEYGEEHPDWFQLHSGRRGPARSWMRYSMCVSNPEFHQKLVELWKKERDKNPGKFININACDNADIDGWCRCEPCLAWEGPQPKDIHPHRSRSIRYTQTRVVSDRYARFYLSVQQLAAKTDPDALVIGYAYANYYPAPLTDIKLNENIIIGFGSGHSTLPREPVVQEWKRQQIAGWGKTGARLLLRPHHFQQGYCMPHLFAHQFADEFKCAARNGLAATDFESLTGQWSTQGPNLYLLARLHVRPEKSADGLLSEYYSAFGPAGKHVKAYFDYWENYMTRHSGVEVRSMNYAASAPALFPQPCFDPAEKLLGDAAAAAAGDSEFAARVEWLQKGLTHAKLAARAAGLLLGQVQDASPVAAERARDELLAFRREVENDGIANMNFCAEMESRCWPKLYKREALRPVADAVGTLEGAPAIPTRGIQTCVALLKTGERFAAQVSCRLVTRNRKKQKSTVPAEWQVFGPDDKLIAKGSVAPGEDARIDLPAMQDGLHLLSLKSGPNVARVTLLNDHAALAGRSIGLFGQGSPMFFFVPEGVKKFDLTLGGHPKWPARARLFSPDGKEVAVGDTATKREHVLEVTVPAGQSGRAWSVQVGSAGRRFEGYTLTLGKELPAYWSHSADRLVIPSKRD